MKTKRAVSSYVLLAGLAGLAIVAGIFIFQVYLSRTRSQLTSEQTGLIKPIDGTIDEKVIENLNSRKVYADLSLEQLSSSPTAQVNLTGNTTPEGGIIEVAPSEGATLSGTTQ